MDSAIKSLRIFQFAMLASILLYVVLTLRFVAQTTVHPGPVVLVALTFLSVMNVAVIFVLRRLMVLRAAAVLRNHPQDAAALVRWRSGYIITYVIAESVALFGLILRFIGFPFAQVEPFFLAGFVLILFFGPRRPPNAIG